MSYSATNSLKVWVSNTAAPTSGGAANTLAQLPAGEIGFYSSTTNLLLYNGVGTGYYAFRKPDGKVMKSKVLTQAATYAASTLKAYSAPVMNKQTITIATATASTFYEIRVAMKIPGLGGDYIKQGVYQSAASGDTTSTIAAALTASLVANFAREGKNYFTFSNPVSPGNTIVIENKLLPYVRNKKQGRPTKFTSMLSFPEASAVIATLTTAGSDGIGHGPYIAEQEWFAQGDQDAFRFNSYPNSFDDKALFALSTGKYNIIALAVDTPIPTANADVNAPHQYILAWNDVGVTPAALITPASVVAGATTVVTGFAQPGASVQLYLNGSTSGSALTANSTTGAWSSATTTIASTDIITATTILANASAGGSNTVVCA